MLELKEQIPSGYIWILCIDRKYINHVLYSYLEFKLSKLIEILRNGFELLVMNRDIENMHVITCGEKSINHILKILISQSTWNIMLVKKITIYCFIWLSFFSLTIEFRIRNTRLSKWLFLIGLNILDILHFLHLVLI